MCNIFVPRSDALSNRFSAVHTFMHYASMCVRARNFRAFKAQPWANMGLFVDAQKSWAITSTDAVPSKKMSLYAQGRRSRQVVRQPANKAEWMKVATKTPPVARRYVVMKTQLICT